MLIFTVLAYVFSGPSRVFSPYLKLERGFEALFLPTVFVVDAGSATSSSSIGLHVTELSPSPDGRNAAVFAFWGEMEDGDRKLFREDDDNDDADTAIALFTP